MSDLSPLPLGGRRHKKTKKASRGRKTVRSYLGVGGQEEMDGGRRRRRKHRGGQTEGGRRRPRGSRKSRK
jgi:hypothetical protein